jgi:hypothetical protein
LFPECGVKRISPEIWSPVRQLSYFLGATIRVSPYFSQCLRHLSKFIQALKPARIAISDERNHSANLDPTSIISECSSENDLAYQLLMSKCLAEALSRTGTCPDKGAIGPRSAHQPNPEEMHPSQMQIAGLRYCSPAGSHFRRPLTGHRNESRLHPGGGFCWSGQSRGLWALCHPVGGSPRQTFLLLWLAFASIIGLAL